MTGNGNLEVEYVAIDRIAELPARLAASQRSALGIAVFGAVPGVAMAALPAEFLALPRAEIGLPVLTGEAAFVEVWSVGGVMIRPGDRDRGADIRYASSRDALFATITITEASHVGDLQCATAHAYDALFALLDAEGFPFPLRFWNYLPDITLRACTAETESEPARGAEPVNENAVERYRSFNAGRQDAFVAHARSIADGAPAACALGTAHGPMTIYVLAAKAAPRAIENPRQISAYRYPPQYGARSPTFSRAALARVGGQEILFISGTASIVGHETVHRGDLVLQTEETLNNIEALLAAVARVGTARPRPDDLLLKIYIRHEKHLDAAQAVVARRFGTSVRAIYLRADICRSELLIEIEAVATFKHEEGR